MKANEDRKLMVACMEYIVRHVNYEPYLDSWLMCGVADGDIPYGSTDTVSLDLEYYAEKDNYKDLCELFLLIMSKAHKCGGLV